MLSSKTFDFLKKLQKNNNREWFQANKSLYEAAKDDFAGFIAMLLARAAEFDEELAGTIPPDCIFRIFRDVRFSKNKDPYKTNLAAYLAPGGRKAMFPGFYIHADFKQSFIAGGLYGADRPVLQKVRQKIADDFEDFSAIIGEPEFAARFGSLSPHGDALAKVPAPFAKDHPAAEFLKFKNFIASRELDQKDFSDVERLVADLRLLKPFNTFFRRVIRE